MPKEEWNIWAIFNQKGNDSCFSVVRIDCQSSVPFSFRPAGRTVEIVTSDYRRKKPALLKTLIHQSRYALAWSDLCFIQPRRKQSPIVLHGFYMRGQLTDKWFGC